MKILDIALKDLTRSMRSAFFIGITVIVPMLITGLIYFAFGGMSSGSADMPAVKVGVVNADMLPASLPLASPLGDSLRAIFFDESVKTWIEASDYPDEAAARAAVDSQEIGMAILIPETFSTDFFAGKRDTPITLIQDPTLTITPLVVRNMLTAALDGVSGGGIAYQTILESQQRHQLTPDASLVPVVLEKYQTWYMKTQQELFHDAERAVLVMSAPANGSTQTTGIANIMGMIMSGQMIFFAFYTGANAMLTIVQEQEEGTLARLFSTPTDRTVILAGKFLAVFLTVFLQGVVLMVAGHFAFKVNWGEPLAAAMAFLGQVIASVGLGVLLIAFVKSTSQGGIVLGGGLTGLGMLGGLFTVTIPSIPKLFKTLTYFTPQGWVLKGWQDVLNGQPASALLLSFAACILIGVLMFTSGALMFRRRFA